MSGGSWDYAYAKMEEWAARLKESPQPLRRALAGRMFLVANAMQAIEWVDSADYAPGDEDEEIRKALGGPDEARAAELAMLIADARRAHEALGRLIDEAAAPPTTG